MNNEIFALIGLAFVPLAAFFIIFKLFVSGMKFSFLFLSCLIGLLAILPAAFVQLYFRDAKIFNVNTMFNVLVTSILLWGLTEEFVKMFFLNFIGVKNKELHVYFVCCLMAGLTFGTLESVVYLINHIDTAQETLGVSQAIGFLCRRMVSAVLIHTACAGLSGLFIWKYRSKNFGPGPFIFAVILHGIYNFFAAFNGTFYYFSYVAIAMAILECRIYYKEITEKVEAQD